MKCLPDLKGTNKKQIEQKILVDESSSWKLQCSGHEF